MIAVRSLPAELDSTILHTRLRQMCEGGDPWELGQVQVPSQN
jgi:hypothetical protein